MTNTRLSQYLAILTATQALVTLNATADTASVPTKGEESAYTAKLVKILAAKIASVGTSTQAPATPVASPKTPGSLALKPTPSPEVPNAPFGLTLKCLTTLNSPIYIGVEQAMKVNAPFSKVAEILDDFEHYTELFPDLSDVHVVSREGHRLLTAWEQHVPIPFVPNIKYEMIYDIQNPKPTLRSYRYQLHQAGKIKKSDGLIMIEKISADQTAYSEWDFFDAEWGALKTFGDERIWKDAVSGIFVSDAALKIKAENPELPHKKARDRAEKQMKSGSEVSECVKSRRPFQD